VGFVFQFYNLVPNLTARENVMISTDISRDPMDVDEVLALVDLSDRADHFPAQLSGGEQQRIAIARAVAKNPRWCCATNRPGVGLCHRQARAAAAGGSESPVGQTVVVITHNSALAAVADRIVHMRSGEITQIGVSESHPAPGRWSGEGAGPGLLQFHQAKGVLLAITSILVIGVTCLCFAVLVPESERAKIQYYRRCRQISGLVKKIPRAELESLGAVGISRLHSHQASSPRWTWTMSKPLNGIVVSLPDRRGPAISDIVPQVGGYFTDRRKRGHRQCFVCPGAGIYPGQWIHLLLNNRRQELLVVGAAISASSSTLAPGTIVRISAVRRILRQADLCRDIIRLPDAPIRCWWR
jgi:energy-coupling factor transporter ATP-binding protein EcfA2